MDIGLGFGVGGFSISAATEQICSLAQLARC